MTGVTRRGLMITAPGEVTITAEPVPRPGADQVLARSVVTGISHGTELTWYRARPRP